MNELLESSLPQTKLTEVGEEESNGRGSSRKSKTRMSEDRGLWRRRRNDERLELGREKEVEDFQDLLSFLKADRRRRSRGVESVESEKKMLSDDGESLGR